MNKNAKIGILYLFLIAGGLWHVLGFFQKTLELLAAPTIIFIALWIGWEIVQNKTNHDSSKLLFVGWCLFVVITSIFIEYIGVKTGRIFGSYQYGKVLKPMIGNVPIAIGFAWLAMLLSSSAVSQKLLGNKYQLNLFITAGVISLLMVLFDLFMEFAAIKLNYWIWENKIPIQNFFSWYLLSFVFVYIGLKMGVLKNKFPSPVKHAYFGQLIYFLLVNLS